MRIQTLKKALSLLLTTGILVGLLSACGAKEYDPVKEIMGYSKDTVLFTVDGEDVTAGEYLFWLVQSIDYTADFYTSVGQNEIPWGEKLGDTLVEDRFKNEATDAAKLYRIVKTKAKEQGYSISAEDKKTTEAEMKSAVEQMGGQEQYDKWLKSMCLTKSGMRELSEISTLYSRLQEGMFREGGEKGPTPEVLAAYVAENDLLKAKHILLLTKNASTKEEYSPEQKAEQKALAEDILKQLNESQDPVALFDNLMNQHSEDTGLASNPNGYLFKAGDMMPEFEAATRALEIGKISGIVESSYGYHIILREDPAKDETLLKQWQGTQMETMIQQWMDDAVVEPTEKFNELNIKDFYEKLLELRKTLEEPAAPAEDEKEPADGAQAPADGKETPADGAQAPADGKETPADGAQAPADGKETPADGAQAPADGAKPQTDGATEAPSEG